MTFNVKKNYPPESFTPSGGSPLHPLKQVFHKTVSREKLNTAPVSQYISFYIINE